jgi:HK97 family phage major capsid protein
MPTLTIDKLISGVDSDISAKLAARGEQQKVIDEVREACLAENRDPSDDEATKVTTAKDARSAIDGEVDALNARKAEYAEEKVRDEALDRLSREVKPAAGTPAYDQVARVAAEERTYSAQKSSRGESSFFRDAFRANYSNDFQAQDRLRRHMEEVKVEREMSERATTTGSYGSLVIPQYLIDQYAPLARAGRPFANTVMHQQLPEEGMTLTVPRGTTGAATAVQATQNSSVQSTDEAVTDLVIPVVTAAGQQDLSRQSLERGTPGMDALVYADLAGAYGVTVDQQCLSGTGSSGQALGVFNTSGVNQATAFGAAATVTTFYSKIGGQINAVETTRFLAPDAIAMHPRRWNWLTTQLDSTGRPLVIPQANGPLNAIGTFETPVDTPAAIPVGSIQGLPVITDASIPTSVGTGPEDQILVYRRADDILWEEGDGSPKELRFEQTLGNQLTVKLVVYGYIAFTAGRYPTANGIVGGNAGTAGFGLVAPTF